MEKTVKLGGQELRLAFSVFTIICYRNTFGRELFEDVERLDKDFAKHKNNFSKPLETVFKLIYALHKPFYSDSFDHFMQKFSISDLQNEHEITELVNTIGELISDGRQPVHGAVYDPKK